MLRKKKQLGLTFVEALVTIGVLSLIMSIAYPVYDNYVKDAHASSLQSQLIDMSNDFDRIKRKNFTYKAILNNDGTFNENIAPLTYPRDGQNIRFNLEVKDIDHHTYKIIATPTEIQGLDYGKLRFEFVDGKLSGKYDSKNDDTWTDIWY